MVRARKPARKRDGRLGPPQGWPKDPEKYGDPLNWKYPVHSPFHARAARRYFNDPANRAKYDESEQAYVDKKINDALSKFGVAAKIRGGVEEREAGIIERDLPVEKPVEDMDLEELLGRLKVADAPRAPARSSRSIDSSYSPWRLIVFICRTCCTTCSRL